MSAPLPRLLQRAIKLAPAPARRAPAPVSVHKAPAQASAAVKRAPVAVHKVLPAPTSKLSGYVRNPARERELTKQTPAKMLLRPPARKVVEMSAHVYDDLSFDKAREVIDTFGELLTDLENEPWVALNGSKETISVTDAEGMECVGFWFNVFNRQEGEDKYVTSVSQIGRKKSHASDTQGILCERRVERPLE